MATRSDELFPSIHFLTELGALLGRHGYAPADVPVAHAVGQAIPEWSVPAAGGQPVKLLGRLSRSATDILIRTPWVSNSPGWSGASAGCSLPRSTRMSPVAVR